MTDDAERPRAGRKGFVDDVMTARFKAGVFARIDAVAGRNRRAEFVREAVERELERREPTKPLSGAEGQHS